MGFERYLDEGTRANLAEHGVEYAKGSKRKKKAKYNGAVRESMQNLLSSKFYNLRDGGSVSVADELASRCIANALANPTPMNVKAITEITGEASVKVEVKNVSEVEKLIAEAKVSDDGESTDN